MKRANTMSTITVELTIKVKTKFTSSNAEKTNGFISPQMSEIFTPVTSSCGLFVLCCCFLCFLCLVFAFGFLSLFVLWRLRDGLLDCVQVLYQFTLEAPQFCRTAMCMR